SLAVVVTAGLIWALFGVVPTRVTGEGVLLADGKAAHTVQPVVAGPVMDVLVKRGDHVAVGAPIARVQQISLETQLNSTETRITALNNDPTDRGRANAAESAKTDAPRERGGAAGEGRAAAGRVGERGLKDFPTADENLFQRGLISRLEVAHARAAHDQTMQD